MIGAMTLMTRNHRGPVLSNRADTPSCTTLVEAVVERRTSNLAVKVVDPVVVLVEVGRLAEVAAAAAVPSSTSKLKRACIV